MAQIRWALHALEQLEVQCEYIAKDSEFYAKLTVRKINNRIKKLALFPNMGTIVPEKHDPTIRELIEGNFRIIYRILNEELVEIASILHCRQNFDSEL